MTRAVVVGSGPNGLAAAIRLATAGVDVLVLEAQARPGGGTRTSELTLPGLKHDDCAGFHPTGVASPYFRSLRLERHGLRWRWPDADLAHPLDDGRAALASRGWAGTDGSLGEDARRWRRLLGPAVRHFDDLAHEVFQPVVHVPRHPVTLGRFGLHAIQSATWIARRFADEPAKALLTGVNAHAMQRLDTPFSASVGMMLTAALHAVGWPVAEGGSESITRALLAELARHGGEVRTGVRVGSWRDIVEQAGGPPDAVVLDTSPTAAVEIFGDALPALTRRGLKKYRYGPGAFKVDLAVEGEIPWRNPAVAAAGTVHLGGSAAELAATEAEVVRGRMPERPFVLLGQQYVADPTRSVGNVNPVYAYAHVPHGFAGDATDAVIAQIERFAPGFRDRVLAVVSRGPAQLAEHDENYIGGDIATGANHARQLLFRPRITLDPYSLGPVDVPGDLPRQPRAYLCSSATPPGAGVHGMGGFHAAESALRHLR